MAKQTEKDNSFDRPPPPGTERGVALDGDDADAIAHIAEMTEEGGGGGEAEGAERDEAPDGERRKKKAERKPGSKGGRARSKAPEPEEEEGAEEEAESEEDADARTGRDADYAKESDEGKEEEAEEDDGSKVDTKALAEKHKKRLRAERERARAAAQNPPDEPEEEEEDPDLDDEEEDPDLDDEEDEEDDDEEGAEEDESDDDEDDEADDDLDDDEDVTDAARPSADRRDRPRPRASGKQTPASDRSGSGEGGQTAQLFTRKEFAKLKKEGFDKTLLGTLKRADQRFQAIQKTHRAQMQAVTRVAKTLVEQDTMQKGASLRSFLAAKSKEGFHDVYGKPGKRLSDAQDTALAKVITRAHKIQRDEAGEGNYISFSDALEAAHGTVNYKRQIEAARAQGRQDVESRIQKRHRKRDLVGGARSPAGGGEREPDDGGDAEATAALKRYAEKNKIAL